MIREPEKAQMDREKVERGQKGDLDPDIDIKAPSATATPNNQRPYQVSQAKRKLIFADMKTQQQQNHSLVTISRKSDT